MNKKMIIEGLKHSGLLMLIALPVGILIGYLVDPEIGVLSGYLLFLASAIHRGYTYFPKYGPLIHAPDGEAFIRLLNYSIGFGLLTMFPLSIISLLSMDGINVFMLVLFVCLAIPLSGMKCIGFIALGRFFNR